ncbi:siderophore-interacting protein [soil metagenome]
MSSVLDRVVGQVGKLLFRDAEVRAVVPLAPHLSRITLGGPDLAGVSWTPGAKVQLRMEGITARTYTPSSWDAEAGTTDLITYDHGDGPGAQWVRCAAVGTHVQLFGPRGSLDLSGLAGTVVLAGDETALGLALALRSVPAVVATTLLFEATDPAALTAAAVALGLEVEVSPAGAPKALAEQVASAISGTDGPVALVLAGDQATIKVVRAHLKVADVRPAATKVKAYWAEGRTGLD